MSSKKLDAAIEALVDALAELPEHELEGWQRGNRLGCASYASLVGAIPASCRRRGRFAASRPEQSRRFSGSRRAGGAIVQLRVRTNSPLLSSRGLGRPRTPATTTV